MLKNRKKGFSLVELIVVIAILAVLIAVLAPSLLSYTERSRAAKDTSAMDEVVNAVNLSLADDEVYDEITKYALAGNASCYIDTTEDALTASKVVTKEGANPQYMYDDNARLADEVAYAAAGSMRGVTITFKPVADGGSTKYIVADGVINEFANDASKKAKVSDNAALYARLKSTVGEEIVSTSQTYRNSDYTIFIRCGTTGGNQANAQDAIVAYGQYNGTNLSAASLSVENTPNQTPDENTDPTENSKPEETVPGFDDTNPEIEVEPEITYIDLDITNENASLIGFNIGSTYKGIYDNTSTVLHIPATIHLDEEKCGLAPGDYKIKSVSITKLYMLKEIILPESDVQVYVSVYNRDDNPLTITATKQSSFSIYGYSDHPWYPYTNSLYSYNVIFNGTTEEWKQWFNTTSYISMTAHCTDGHVRSSYSRGIYHTDLDSCPDASCTK